MDGKFSLERREWPVERVGGVGDVELGVLLIREQVREVVFEGTVRAAHLLVRVVPLRFSRDECFGRLLLDEVAPCRVPLVECVCEGFLVGVGERERQLPQFFPGVGLRPPREVLRHLLHLVELAHLYRNILENVEPSARPQKVVSTMRTVSCGTRFGTDTETASSFPRTHTCERFAAPASCFSVCLPLTYACHNFSRSFSGRRSD